MMPHGSKLNLHQMSIVLSTRILHIKKASPAECSIEVYQHRVHMMT